MKKVFTLSLLSLFASVSIVAQSANTVSNSTAKQNSEITPVVKIDKSKIKPVVNVRQAELNNKVQPVKKEEEIKSIETKQK